MTRKQFLALATVTLLVAAFLRIWQLAIYPPGPHYDEAAELLIARSIAFGGARFFPMVEAYQGREVLFYYLSVPLLTLIHDGILSLSVLSVFCNLITIAASIALGRAMFRGKRGVIVGLAVGVLMTLSFPQIWGARQAFRSSALPMMQALALLFLWRGLKAGSRFQLASSSRDERRLFFLPSPRLRGRGVGGEGHGISLLILAGIFAGGALYTYNSSRLFPFWLLIGGIALLWFDRTHWRDRLRQGAIFFGTLAIIAVPMAIYAVQRPDVFFGRLAEVTQADKSVTLAQSIVLHLRMFFIEGDPYFRYNIPGRPYFTLPEGVLMLIGIVVASYRLTQRTERPTERAAYLLVLLSPLMVIPSVISVGGLPPSHMRSLGMVPLIFVLVALGAEWAIHQIDRWNVGAHLRVPPKEQTQARRSFARLSLQLNPTSGVRLLPSLHSGRGWGLPFVVILLIGGILVGDLYFRWASRADVFYETDADLAAAARWLVDQHITDTPVYIAARDKGHPTVMIEPVPPVTWLGTDSLFAPAPGVTGLYIFPHSAPAPPDWAAWLAPGKIDGLPLAPDGQPAFEAFRVTGDVPLPVSETTLEANNRYLTFVGADAPSIEAGAEDWLTMAWRIDAVPEVDDLTPLLMLEDRHGSLIYRGDTYMAGTSQWRVGETLIQRIKVRVPPATPPGDYRIQIAWVGRASDVYVPYFNQNGGVGAIWSEIGSLTVTRPTVFPDPSALPIGVPQDMEVAPGVRLLGWNVPPISIRPGEVLPLTLYWQATDAARSPLTLRALLVGERGETVLWQGQPIDDRYLADQWAEGEVLADPVRWLIPRDQVAGDYALALAFDGKSIGIGTLTVAGVARQFDTPAVEQEVNINFGDQILLYGYTIRRTDNELSIDLIWKALDNIDQDFKVFVHFINRDGTILAQRDTMPQMDMYPTSLWLTGEYVVDTYQFPAFETGSVLRVGLYSPVDGTRLNVLDQKHNIAGDYLEIQTKVP